MCPVGLAPVLSAVEDFAASFFVLVQPVTVCVLPKSFKELLHVADKERAVFVSLSLVVVVQRMPEPSVQFAGVLVDDRQVFFIVRERDEIRIFPVGRFVLTACCPVLGVLFAARHALPAGDQLCLSFCELLLQALS